MKLWPIYDKEEKDEIANYQKDKCYIKEGQFVHDELQGFGRAVFGDGYAFMGWVNRDDNEKVQLHGFALQNLANGNTVEGLFDCGENTVLPRNYNPTKYFEAQNIVWNDYLIELEKAEEQPTYTLVGGRPMDDDG